MVADLDRFLDLEITLRSAGAPDELGVGEHDAEKVVVVVGRREVETEVCLCVETDGRVTKGTC
jgi:hypothetical protein